MITKYYCSEHGDFAYSHFGLCPTCGKMITKVIHYVKMDETNTEVGMTRGADNVK